MRCINQGTEDTVICSSLLTYFLVLLVLDNVMVGMILGRCISLKMKLEISVLLLALKVKCLFEALVLRIEPLL